MKYYLLLLTILISNISKSQNLECDRYFIFDLNDTLTQIGPAVNFKMTTDINTYNTGYTDLYFVNQFNDTLTIYGNWSNWLPSITEIPEDTISYTLYFINGFTSFPTNFNGYLVTKNPNCNIPFNYSLMNINQKKYAFDIIIFPNPALNEIQVINNSTKNLTKIELYDLRGQLILTQKNKLEKIDISNFDKGIYILKLFSYNKRPIIRKLIKK